MRAYIKLITNTTYRRSHSTVAGAFKIVLHYSLDANASLTDLINHVYRLADLTNAISHFYEICDLRLLLATNVERVLNKTRLSCTSQKKPLNISSETTSTPNCDLLIDMYLCISRNFVCSKKSRDFSQSVPSKLSRFHVGNKVEDF